MARTTAPRFTVPELELDELELLEELVVELAEELLEELLEELELLEEVEELEEPEGLEIGERPQETRKNTSTAMITISLYFLRPSLELRLIIIFSGFQDSWQNKLSQFI